LKLNFALAPVPPFRLDLTAWTLRRTAANVVDRWDGTTYRRVLALEGGPAEVAVCQTGPADSPRLEVAVTAAEPATRLKSTVVAVLERLLGLRIDLCDFYELAGRDPRLASLVDQFRGVKPPRFPTLFEALVNAIACQQITLVLGITLLNRLAETCGLRRESQNGVTYAFPRPADVAVTAPETLRGLGFSRQKAAALIELARASATQGLASDELGLLDDEGVIRCLTRLRGVGRWTAEYALLRALGRLHVFPGDDVGARSRLQRWMDLQEPLDYEGVRRVLHRWRPYAGLIYFHLLLRRLAEARCL
jgi:DNA-3-methyladenine glycosylase II